MTGVPRLAGLASVLLCACVGNDLPPSVWPPPNFSLTVEELRQEDASLHVVRRLHVDADGVVFYGTSSRPLVDDATGTSLPVFDRLALYRLEPTCLRALARRLDRLGVGELVEGASPATPIPDAQVGMVLTWHAFEQHRVLTGQGRVRGPMAEILAVVAAHLPGGEEFETRIGRPVVPVLRGVPTPATSVDGALSACRRLLDESGDEPALLLHAYALACAAGRRDVAEELLERWQVEDARRRTGLQDDAGAPRLDAALLTRLLPPPAE